MNNFISQNKSNFDLNICVENLRMVGRLGIHSYEEVTPQEIVLSSRININRDPATITKIEHTLNYAAVVATMRKVVQSKHFALVEQLSHTIISEIFREFDLVVRIFLKITKPQALSFAEVSIETTVTRKFFDAQ